MRHVLEGALKIVHFLAGLGPENGMANTARQFATEEVAAGHESVVTDDLATLDSSVDMVYIHGAWLPILWRAARTAKRFRSRLVIRPAGSYDPIRLAYHGWKKQLVSCFERHMLRQADMVMSTCPDETEWIRAYEPRVRKIELTDLKRFFNLNHAAHELYERDKCRPWPLHLLYLGRRHPLKGVKFLEEAVREVQGLGKPKTEDSGQRMTYGCELKIVSNAFGEEKELVWDWCEVLVLPTLSENFGRVVAEALERGKHVITTDGAPAWGDGNDYGGRLIYLRGYRDGTRDERVALLKKAIKDLIWTSRNA